MPFRYRPYSTDEEVWSKKTMGGTFHVYVNPAHTVTVAHCPDSEDRNDEVLFFTPDEIEEIAEAVKSFG